MSVLVPGTTLHTRTYDVDAVVVDDSHFKLVGHVQDVKPDGLWSVDDPDPLTIHDMTVTMTVAVAGLLITAVDVEMSTHPQHECPFILPIYQQLVGLSIARGFTHKVREMFGGPRACTHIGALINAMAPVAMQVVWSFSHLMPDPGLGADGDAAVMAARRRGLERNRNTCHVFAEDGPMFQRFERGETRDIPLWAEKRLGELDIELDVWVAKTGR